LSDGGTNHWQGHDFTTVSRYVAISWQFGDADGLYVSPSAGVRYYEHSDFGSAWSPHLGVVAGFGPLTGHVGYARGVVFPGLDVVVFSEEVIPMLGESWKTLDPEVMDHYEIGVSYAPGDIVELEAVWFYNDGRDRYVFVTSPTSRPVYGNVEEYVTNGVELSAGIHPADNLAVFLGGTYMWKDPSDTPYVPTLALCAGLTWRFLSAFTFSADVQYSDEMYVSSQARRANAVNIEQVDGYTVVNAKLSYAFTTASEKISGKVFVAGENLTDAGYEYRPGYPMPGLNGMAGVSLCF
jgi:iron complex outermembrane receptor protein